ncbi:MAG TPA: DUF488 domain-containing protein [Ktedonobacteraceae bacterium]
MIHETSLPAVLFSIGHSNQSIETFLSLLHQHQLQVLVDVRSSPYSRHVPHFNSNHLSLAVQQTGIKYVFLGKKLGGRPDGDEFYDADDYVLYDQMATASFFQEGLERIKNIGNRYKAALLCSEENPAVCHRHLLIGRVLRQQGCHLMHIRGNGRLQTEEELASSNEQSLWGEALAHHEEKAWKSIRPVLRKKQQISSLERSNKLASNGLSTFD